MSGDPTRVEGAEPPATTPAPAARNSSGHAAGNAGGAAGSPAGTKTERDAPGTSKDDRADGLR